MTKYEIIKNWIETIASDRELVDIVKEINSYNWRLEEYCCYKIEKLNELFCDTKPTDLLQKLADNFDTNTEYFRLTIYGIESTSIEDMADEIRNYAEDIAKEVENVLDNIHIPSSLLELIEYPLVSL